MEEKILDLIVEMTKCEEIRQDLDVDLFKNGLLDSLGTIELLIELDQRFGILIEASELDRSEIATARKLLAFIARVGRR
ncbi:MAG: D-alanine--poly(phosphoribitol) ligase subunit DltC [Spirochaetota bacterium]